MGFLVRLDEAGAILVRQDNTPRGGLCARKSVATDFSRVRGRNEGDERGTGDRDRSRTRRAVPDVELVDFEVRGQPPTLTLFIDRPGGVDLDLCAAVSQSLEELRERYALEVSSPGLDRRLRKPEHFAAQLGREVAVQTARPIEGRRNFRGVLAAADDQSITLTLEGGGQRYAAVRSPRQGPRGLRP